MVTFETFRKLALALSDVREVPHFEKTSFKRKSKIFAVYNAKEKRACLKLSLIDQDVFAAFNKEIIHPVPNKWGTNGWTLFYIEHLNEDLFTDALQTAYREVANK
jgi:predicted DNA-binding protein (MmcQ/YjbR family)